MNIGSEITVEGGCYIREINGFHAGPGFVQDEIVYVVLATRIVSASELFFCSWRCGTPSNAW